MKRASVLASPVARWFAAATVPLPVFVLVAIALAPRVQAQRGDAFDAKLRAAAEERTLLHVPPGFEVQLVATDPEIEKPMNLAFDSAGQVWVTGSTLYPWPARRDALGQPIATFEKNWSDTSLAFRAAATPPEPAEQGRDTVRVLSDFGPDGRARSSRVFADALNIPIGILPLPRGPGDKGDSVIVYSIPAIWRLTDTDGDGRADKREKLYDGFGFKDTHGMSSSYWLWLDGWVYGTHGFSNTSTVTDRSGHTVTLTSGNTYRFKPDGSRFEVFAHGQTNPFGLAFDARGDVYTADSHSKPVYLLVPGGSYEGINRTADGLGFAPPITLDDHGSSAIAGVAHYSAAQFPPEYRDALFNGNPVTRRINRTRLEWRGSTPAATRQPDFLTSDDAAFRPVQVKLGPDGALWIADFYNPIIGHYEVPLTHPGRDHSHGRIWRVVWRGLDGSAPVPALPNLARESTPALAAKLADSNLVVRSLALNELLARPDAATVVSSLRASATRLINGTDATADESVALPLLLALERLGAGNDALLLRALQRPGSEVAVAALRTLAARPSLDSALAPKLASALSPLPTGYVARIAAELFQRHPLAWQPPLLLAAWAKAPASDPELIYALRLALKTHALHATPEVLREWAALDTATAERVAEICLAVPTDAAAQFLLGHLQRTNFQGARAGEFARHAAQHLAPDQFSAVTTLLAPLRRAPVSQRLAFAEGLASVAAKPDRTLPPDVAAWMRDELLAACTESDAAIVYRGVVALKDLPLAEKSAPLRQLALNKKSPERNRTAALRSLDPKARGTEATLAEVLSAADAVGLRRTAAELLGEASGSEVARRALIGGFASAPSDLALTLATSLAKSEAGARDLLDAAAAGKMPRALLRHRYVATALAKRDPALRERAAELTRELPPEDARLDAVIAQRLAAAGALKPDATRGAAVFAQNCAACHRINNSGGSIGPSLDGLSSRSVARLVEDILDPSRNVDPAFRLTTVTLQNGETRAGLNPHDESGRLVLTDPSTGRPLSLPRADVKEVAVSAVSPMPAVFETLLSEPQLFDLIEFLRRPRAEK